MDGVTLARVIFAVMGVAGVVWFLWVKRKPAGWLPPGPGWMNESLLGTVDRDVMLMNAGVAIGIGFGLLFASFSWLD